VAEDIARDERRRAVRRLDRLAQGRVGNRLIRRGGRRGGHENSGDEPEWAHGISRASDEPG
jgi:hypothetical protein